MAKSDKNAKLNPGESVELRPGETVVSMGQINVPIPTLLELPACVGLTRHVVLDFYTSDSDHAQTLACILARCNELAKVGQCPQIMKNGRLKNVDCTQDVVKLLITRATEARLAALAQGAA